MTNNLSPADSTIVASAGGANKAKASVSAPKLLHLGCGSITPAEWTNVDGSFNAWLYQHPMLRKLVGVLHLAPRSVLEIHWSTNIIVADLRKRLPFPDNSFDAVFSSHTMEHLFRNQALGALKEAHRVLKPGGRCRTLVPDLEAIVRDYLEETKSLQAGTPVSPERDDPGRTFVGRLHTHEESREDRGIWYGLYRNITDFHAHKWMYDHNSLLKLMTEAGFVNCRRRGYLESEIPHIDKVEHEARAIDAAIVEGMKPI